MNVLIKVSGDAKSIPLVEGFIRSEAEKKERHVVVLVGGGTEISRQLKSAGYPVAFNETFQPPRRITRTRQEKLIVQGVLADEVTDWQTRLADMPNIKIISPFQDIGGVLCNVNGDDFVKMCCTEFDEVIVVTRSDRVDAKQALFANFPVRLIHF
ncbi:MAG: hypothetical protein AAB783_01620 [Patescibacteria group bacterium]